MKRKQKSESACKLGRTKHRIVVGIDQSYADSGITIVFDGKVKQVLDCKPPSKYTNTETRNLLREVLQRIFTKLVHKKETIEDCDLVCIIERIRLQSAKPGEQHFINLPYIKGIGALNAVIVDLATQFDIPVYSVDTRSWKVQVVGTSKPMSNTFGFPEEKWPTIRWCLDRRYEHWLIEECSPKKKKGVIEREGCYYTYNDNKADSIGIALYGFVNQQKLEREY